ncbi:sugar phosphate nucleotidyltransferase [Planomicrobium okeanokoites]|uniref:sugar phosphate nucleotidyltransferase n=1 Tax=Planomicrobium okeanokoites TaxID=244 RepID=UPI002490A576|nr:sugar phosphate nucleotidyltransferase [Planomicrobium okeanokoites]
MNLILLSGGSGKRLWPISNDARSKQFLKLLNNETNLESMVQRVWRQLKEAGLQSSTVIATSKAQVEILKSQLGSTVPLIIEPERRDTFPAVALAASYMYSKKNLSLDTVIAVLPVDPYVNIDFFNRIQELENTLIKSHADLALVGVKPTYASEKYGYIVTKNKSSNDYLEVSRFKEKPSEYEAATLISQNAYWNCGVFAFKLKYIVSILEARNMPVQYDELLKNYNDLEKISFDYAVVEKAEKITMLPYNGEWKDLGTWNTLTDEMEAMVSGKGIISEDSVNTHIINELDIPIAVLGIKNAVVAASYDGILVTDKIESPNIKKLMKDFEQRPMYEERHWGWYKILDYTKYPGQKEVLTKRIGIKAGSNLSYQKHFARTEIWTITNGYGELAIDDQIKNIKAGDVITIPIGTKHGIKALQDLEIIEVQYGNQLIDEDILRLNTDWDEVKALCKVNYK